MSVLGVLASWRFIPGARDPASVGASAGSRGALGGGEEGLAVGGAARGEVEARERQRLAGVGAGAEPEARGVIGEGGGVLRDQLIVAGGGARAQRRGLVAGAAVGEQRRELARVLGI